MAKQPEIKTDLLAAGPASVAPADASPPAAAPASTAELTHKLRMYSAVIETSFCHTHARLTFNAGEVREYSSTRGSEPTAFAQARDAAKVAYVEAHAPKKKPRKESN